FGAEQIDTLTGSCGKMQRYPALFLDPPRVLPDQVNLVAHYDALYLSGQGLIDLHPLHGLRFTRSEQAHDDVGALDLPPCPRDADAFHFVRGFTQARGIDDVQRDAFELDRLAQGIASGASNVGDDGALFARQPV